MSESLGISDILERQGAAAETPAEASPENDAAAAAEALRRQLADRTKERDEAARRAHDAEQRRHQAETEAQRIRESAQVSDQAAVTYALSAAQQEEERLQAELTAAGEAGDFRRLGEVSAKLGRVGARIEQLQAGANAFETRRAEALRSEPARPVTPADPIEADLAQRTPRTAAWLRDHREFYTDRKFNQRVTGAHSLAIANDLQPDTDEYFRFVEETIGLTKPVAAQERQPAPARDAPAAGVPPSRNAPSMSGRAAAGDIVITAEDRKIAEWMGVNPEEYAKEKALLEHQPGALYRNGKR